MFFPLVCVCAVLSGCTSAGVLTIWHPCVQRKARALQQVFFPFGMRVCSAERAHFSGCSYHLACVQRKAAAGVLTIWHPCVQRKAGALQRVFFPFGLRVCSAQRVRSAGVLTIWHPCVQRKAGALQLVFLPFGMRVCSAERVHLSGCSYHLACVCAVLSACTLNGVLTIWHACVCVCVQ